MAAVKAMEVARRRVVKCMVMDSKKRSKGSKEMMKDSKK
jgi:hypothetical protein